MSMRQLIMSVLGKPYVLGARGPDAFDCWGLVKHVLQSQDVCALPDWTVDSLEIDKVTGKFQDSIVNAIANDWAYVTHSPQNMDIAIFARRSLAHHVGLYINDSILHIRNNNAGVVCEPLARVVKAGLGKIEYYRWARQRYKDGDH